jgi:hypothetical protein
MKDKTVSATVMTAPATVIVDATMLKGSAIVHDEMLAMYKSRRIDGDAWEL